MALESVSHASPRGHEVAVAAPSCAFSPDRVSKREGGDGAGRPHAPLFAGGGDKRPGRPSAALCLHLIGQNCIARPGPALEEWDNY